MEALATFRAQRVPGKGRGRELGFPTVNLRIPEGLGLPYGVYACWVRISGRTYPAALHYGPVPAFGEEEPSLEVHVLDHVLDFTPDQVEVEVVRWIRPVLSFASADELRAQIQQDLTRCREILSGADDPVDRVTSALQRRGVAVQVYRFGRSTRTAQEAAEALGTTPERIVKSLVFLADDQPILVMVSGAHRVSLAKLKQVTGAARVRPADAHTVERVTGYSPGAVPPVGHTLPVFMDQALLTLEVVYAGAGDPQALFGIRPEDLRTATAATVADLREEQ